jgi:hypothetical protein
MADGTIVELGEQTWRNAPSDAIKEGQNQRRFMAGGEEPKKEGVIHPLEPRAWMKRLTTWWKLGEIAVFLGGIVVPVFVGIGKGPLLAIGAGLLILAGLGSSLLVRWFLRQQRNAVEVVMATQILSTGDKVYVKKSLGRATAVACVTFILSGLLALAFAGVITWDALDRWLHTAVPKELKIKEAEYFNPTRDKDMVANSPFLRGLIDHLQQEGEAEGNKVRVFWAVVNPMPHPTRPFNLEVGFDGKSYEVVGYVFRRSKKDRDMYEGIRVGFGSKNALSVAVPPSNRGDELFILARIALIGDSEFPADLKTTLRLTPSEDKESK